MALSFGFGSTEKAKIMPQIPQNSSQAIHYVGNVQTPQKQAEKVLIAQKTVHKGMLFGQISNGGGMVDLGEGYGIQFIVDESMFVTSQLFKFAINQPVRTQTWNRTKTKIIKEARKEPEQRIIETVHVSDDAGEEQIL